MSQIAVLVICYFQTGLSDEYMSIIDIYKFEISNC